MASMYLNSCYLFLFLLNKKPAKIFLEIYSKIYEACIKNQKSLSELIRKA